MKNIYPIAILLFLANLGFGQTDWRLGGNSTYGDQKLGTNDASDLIFETHNLERLRLTDLGNVGIGTINPEAKLHLIGDMKMTGSLSVGGTLKNGSWSDPMATPIRMVYSDAEGNLKLLHDDNYIASAAHSFDCFIRIGQNYPAPAWQSIENPDHGIMFTGVGCPAWVGIGTDSPKANLDVRGNIYSNRIYIGNNEIIDYDYRMRVAGETGLNSTGNILDVKTTGETAFTYYGEEGFPFKLNNGNNETHFLRMHQSGTIDLNYFGNDGGIVFGAHDFVDNKDIAILTDDGKWWCQGVVVTHVPFWGDFVFESDYNRMSLAEVETYIKENKHLPGIPSAKEVDEHGIELSEMIRLLTIKVEELTLEAIEQQKKIDHLQVKLQQVENTKN